MEYKYAKEKSDYSDYSSGRVFHSLSGHPAFPIQLASEIFQRCLAHRKTIYNISAPVTLYDPCCGAAYHLSVLAYLHGEFIQEIIASDVAEKAVELAKRNLGLLDMTDLERRIAEIETMIDKYCKDSHKDVLKSAHTLKVKLSNCSNFLVTRIFQANALSKEEILKNIKPKSVDIIFTDVPYGQHSNWQDSNESNPLWSMLDAFRDVLSTSSIVAVVSNKGQKALHEAYQRIEQFQIGKRRILILKPI